MGPDGSVAAGAGSEDSATAALAWGGNMLDANRKAKTRTSRALMIRYLPHTNDSAILTCEVPGGSPQLRFPGCHGTAQFSAVLLPRQIRLSSLSRPLRDKSALILSMRDCRER